MSGPFVHPAKEPDLMTSRTKHPWTATWWAIVAVVLSVILRYSCPLYAQATGIILTGRITAPDGAPIPNAQISIANARDNKTKIVVSDVHGAYIAANLSPGQYEVSASAQGFYIAKAQLALHAIGKQVFNLVLQPRQNGVGGQTDFSGGGVVNSQTVRNIPLNGRSASDAALLEPGVSASRAPASGASAQRGFGNQITISGVRPRQNDSRLDGISINDYANSPPGSAAGVNLGVDAVQQITVLSGNYPAKYGNSSGGIVSFVTRSGTEEFHGSAFEFARNSVFDARNFFDIKKPPFTRNQFGGTIGGPIWKRRTFIFAAYEGLRQSLGISQVNTVPTVAARAGQLSTGNIAVDPTVLSFMNAFYPLPNGPILSPGDTGIYNFAGQQVIPENYFNTKVDQTISKQNSLSGTYMQDSATVRQPDEFNNKRTGYDSERQVATLDETHSFSKDAVNSVRLGMNRVVATTGLTFAAGNPQVSSTSFGSVPGQNAPQVSVTGLTSFTGGLGSPSNYNFHWTSIQGYDDFSLIRGRHSFKFGVAFERNWDNILGISNPGGTFAFNSLADFLTNQPYSLSAAIPGVVTERGLRQSIAATYFQDHWRVRPNLTIDLGLRYEPTTVPTEAHNRLTVLRNLTDATPHLGSPLFANPTMRNFQPRVGFLSDPFSDGKSTIGAGFGVFDVLPLLYLVQFNEVLSAPYFKSVNSTNLPAGSFPNTAFTTIANSTSSFRQAYFEPHPPRSYVMQWNLSLQRQLTENFIIKMAYVGSRSVHQPFRSEDADIVLPTLTPQGYLWPQPVGSGTRLNPNAGRITAGFWRSDAYYDALEVHLNGKVKRAVLEASYTWGKTIDTSSASIVGDEYLNSISSPLWFNPGINRGLADFNIAQNLELNYTWSMGTPGRVTGFRSRLLGGWQQGGIFEVSTGVPFTPTIGGDALGLKSTDPVIDVPNFVGGRGCRSQSNADSPFNYIRTQCFAFPIPNTLRGNLGRNTVIGPGLMNFDASLIKNTYVKSISDTFDVQFRAEFFNVLNHANFAPPLTNKNLFTPTGQPVANAGVITSTQTPSREIQFAIKAIW